MKIRQMSTFSERDTIMKGTAQVIAFLLIVTTASLGSEILLFEDCEDTAFTEWFLERSIGTSYYWEELMSELTRSDETPVSGNYCMTYDPWTTGNPHANEGFPVTHGNTGGFLFDNVHTSTYYFRWQQRWQTDINYTGTIQNKNIYIGYGEWGGDFVFVLAKNGDDNFHITIRSNPGYTITYNRWLTFSGGNLDNMEWHMMEVYLDLGTTGPTGSFFVRVDGVYVADSSNVHFRDEINQNNGVALRTVGWPSNLSGGTPIGNGRTWLDDMEIWDGLPETGISIEDDRSSATDAEPTAYNSGNTVIFNNLNQGDRISVFDITGRLIHNYGCISESVHQWNVISNPNGIYLFVIESDDGCSRTSGSIAITR
ncbi:MAG: T9SS type A sorting domain-containing protein [Candidatus Aegiribacteria sp.]|nr:T9SS type A sorting domain-containing protein [Candidatus Aegiribacteria sp.]